MSFRLLVLFVLVFVFGHTAKGSRPTRRQTFAGGAFDRIFEATKLYASSDLQNDLWTVSTGKNFILLPGVKPYKTYTYKGAKPLTPTTDVATWDRFFRTCFTQCKNDKKCRVVVVYLSKSNCAFYASTSPACVYKVLPVSTSKSTQDMAVMAKKAIASENVKVPSGYSLMPFTLSDQPCTNQKLKVISLVPETCSSSKMRQENINKCTAKCNADPTCVGFGYVVTLKTAQCQLLTKTSLVRNMNPISATPMTALFLKSSTYKCPAGQFFAYEDLYDTCENDSGAFVKATLPKCKPYLAAGDVCDADDFPPPKQLFSSNNGCAPGLRCGKYDGFNYFCYGKPLTPPKGTNSTKVTNSTNSTSG